ncbi:unnamed protein product [Lampetra fluviatilis]
MAPSARAHGARPSLSNEHLARQCWTTPGAAATPATGKRATGKGQRKLAETSRRRCRGVTLSTLGLQCGDRQLDSISRRGS